jgi:hypothetical protein
MSAEFVEFGPPVLFVDDLDRSRAFYAETLVCGSGLATRPERGSSWAMECSC